MGIYTEGSPSLKGSSILLNDEYFMKMRNSSGIYERNQIEWYKKFDRIGCIDPYNSLKTTREFVFFTKPDLHIFEDCNPSKLNPEIANMPIFRDGLTRYNEVLQQLQYSVKSNAKSPFMNILSNSLKSNLDMPSMSADSMQTSANIHGTSISYRRSSLTSDNAPEFSLEFEDTKFLEVYMLLKFYDEYERKKWSGSITPPDEEYTKNKILHDQFAIYKFVVGEDFETIIYYSKYYGSYFTSVPREAFSEMATTGGLRFTVQFKAQFVEDMDPSILSDFNILCSPLLDNYGRDIEWYDDSIQAANGEWANIPFVVIQDSLLNRRTMYKLKWR